MIPAHWSWGDGGARLPESLMEEIRRIEDVEQSDRSTAVRKLLRRAITEWKKEYAAKLYAEGRLTLERAAMDSGVSVREMMEYLKQRKIPAQYDVEDFEQDMKRFYQRMSR